MKAELMRYRNDSRSYALVLLGLALDAVYLMLLYSTRGIVASDKFGFPLGIDILFNIVFLLAAFLTAEKIKTYTLNWCWVSLALGVLQIPRIFFPIAFKGAGQLVGGRFAFALILILGSAALLIGGCVLSFINSRKLNAYLKQINERA